MSQGLFQKFAPLSGALRGLIGNGASPFGVSVERVLSPTEAIIGGRPTILAGTNNYLGLTFDPACISAAKAALDRDGTGTTGSRIANGNYGVHGEIERALARFLGRRSAMLFTTGYQANLGILSTVVGPEDYLLLDADCHASIYDGLKMGNATVIRFRHNDAADLDRRLQRLCRRERRQADRRRRHLQHARRPGAAPRVRRGQAQARRLSPDRRGAFPGRARRARPRPRRSRRLRERCRFRRRHLQQEPRRDRRLLRSDHPEFELLRIVCRPYMYTASLPPSVVASCLAALKQVETRPELMQSLARNARRFHGALTELGFELCAEPSPIVSVRLPDPPTAYAFWKELLELGVFVTLAVPPATPNGWCILRSSVCAAHTETQIDRMAETYRDVSARLGVAQSAKAAVGA